jgi:hypothetical protein
MGFSCWLRGRTLRRPAAPPSRPRLDTLEDRTVLSQIGLTVGSLADSGAGSLRAAILTADAGSASDKFTIGFTVTGTINLLSPLPELSNTIAILGPRAASLTVQRDPAAVFPASILTVESGQTASLSGLTIADGQSLAVGGGIDNLGTVIVSGCALASRIQKSVSGFAAGFRTVS